MFETENETYEHYWNILMNNCGCTDTCSYNVSEECKTFINFLTSIDGDNKVFTEIGTEWDMIMKCYVKDFVIPNIKLGQNIDITKWKYFI